MSQDRLHLERGRWYGWQMLPGYGDGPYFSPILVSEVTPRRTGRSVLRLAFYNARYAEGVRDAVKDLQILTHHSTHLVAAELDTDGRRGDRTVVVSQMTPGWLRVCQPDLLPRLDPLLEAGGDLQSALSALASRSS